MANYRHMIIQLDVPGTFDGTTFAPAPNIGVRADGAYLPADAAQTSRYLRLQTVNNVGRLTPQMLGRDGKTNGLVRAFSDGPVDEGDTYFGIGSNIEIEASPQGAARTTVVQMDTRLDRAPPIELGPTDDLCLTRSAVGGRNTVHLIIQDLDDVGLLSQSQQVAASGVLPPTNVEVRTMNAGGAILPWTGFLYLRLNCDAGEVFVLRTSAT
jgi:hypothetical protein